MKASILILEDDLPIAKVVCALLKQAGYAVRHVDDADSAYETLKRERFDLLISDIEMPGISGLKLLEILKQDARFAPLPVIMLTVRGEEELKVQGLQTGADDYVLKPFSSNELLARVEALLRRVRNAGRLPNTLAAGAIVLDFDGREVTVHGRKTDLTPAEFEILALLMRRPGIVLTYSNLIDELSGDLRGITSGTLYNHVKNLRRKLGDQADLIETVYGTGYRLAKS